MLIKPLISKEKGSIKSLPSKSEDSRSNHPCAYFGTQEEKTESIEIEGRLLMLPIMYEEYANIQNKRIHDSSGCIETWPLCKCTFAKTIRMKDIGGTNWTLDW